MPPTILLSCDSISKSFGVKPLFSDLSLSIHEGDHIGLVGPNGSGKSTLLKILAGLEQPDRGARSARRHVRIGYVPQEPVFPDGRSVDGVLAQALR
jgi:ABC transport system ATP-binding/permease protein